MAQIFGFSPEQAKADLIAKANTGELKLGDRLEFFENWLTNLERRIRIIERDTKIQYPTEEPK